MSLVLTRVVSNGVDLSEGPPITASSGLSMFVYSIVQYKLNVSICKVISTSNIAEGGANFSSVSLVIIELRV